MLGCIGGSLDIKKVKDDVIDGYVSKEAARHSYGVVINEDMEINYEETELLRSIGLKN